MSTDDELLELAAKAAGIVLHRWSGMAGFYEYSADRPARRYWNPLTDDGDALRLAAHLEIDIEFHVNVEAIAWGRRSNGEQRHVTTEIGLSLTATRRAIVRAAAEIGRAMP